MKYRFIRVMVTLLAGLPLGGAIQDSGESGYYLDTVVKGIPNGESDYSFTLKFKGTREGYHSFYYCWYNELTKTTPSFQNDSAYPTSYVVRNASWNRVRLTTTNTLNMSVTIPRKVIANNNNMLYIYHAEYTDSSYQDKKTHVRSVKLDIVKPQTINLLPDSKTYSLTNCGFGFKNGLIKTNPYTLQTKDWPSEYFLSHYKNRIPFDMMGMRVSDYFGDNTIPSYGSAYLKVYSHLDRFSLWPLRKNGLSKWREIPLKFYETGDGYYRPGLKDPAGVTMDGRSMKLSSDMKDGDLLTDYIYLPPVKRGETDIYNCEIVLNNYGPNAIDTVSYLFSIIKEFNGIGACENSEYCLEEI